MADNTVNFVINVQGNASTAVAQVNTQFNQLNQTAKETQSLFGKIGQAALHINNIIDVIGRVTSSMQEFANANKLQQVAENQLAKVMKNTMGASMDEINSIKELASAQQQLGVIGDEVQLAGAKELSIHLKKSDTLKKLLPLMNDYIATNDGLEATQSSAASAGELLGKAMEGNVTMLERTGIKFSEAQKKIMQTGNEEERASVLAEVLGNRVGGMNEALAKTPEGQIQKTVNSIGDLKEAIGQVYVKLQAALIPAVNTAINAFYGLMTFCQNYWPLVVGLTGAIAAFTIAVNAHAIVTGIVSKATKIWAGVQALLNVVLHASPLTWIITAIVALIGVIAFLCIKVKGWGTLWEAVVTFAKETFYAFVDGVKGYFFTLLNSIMIVLDKIKEGWYKFKIAVGIGDEDENLAALRKVQDDVKQRADAIAAAAKVEKEHLEKARHAFDNVNLEWDNKVTVKSVADKLKAQLGLSGDVIEDNSETNISEDLSNASTSISSGGKNIKNFNITINDGLVNGVQNYFNSSDDNPETASDFMWRLSNALQMILNDVNYAAN